MSTDPTQPQLPLPAEEASYFTRRMHALGILPEINSIDLWQGSGYNSQHKGENFIQTFPIFTESPGGIDILVYTIDRWKIKTHKDAQRSGITIKASDKDYKLTRLYPELVKKDGSIQKYMMPKGEPTYPFFPPPVIKKYDKAATIDTLYITEGYFKAFKACLHGIDCVGLPSITCMRDTATGGLHTDIVKLIAKCNVERIVWLTDGDCRNITTNDITEGKDLRTRPKNFFNTITTFYDLVSKLEVQKYFAHINSDDLATTEGDRVITPGPKGLDDLLCEFPDDIPAIRKEFADFSKITKSGIYTGTYLTRVNISHNTIRINQYFFLNDVDEFYKYHSEKRPDFKALKTFKFGGTIYRFDDKEGKCAVEIPSSASDYKRVGNDYFQHIYYPDKWGKLHKGFDLRLRSTIIEDNPIYGKKIFEHIQKLHRFVVVPSHTDYQQIINNCWNLYHPFIHEPEEGDCLQTIDFIKHIFGSDLVQGIPRWQLGLDYITILYKYPQQILPILCLVSSERQTGKTTFVNWLDKVFAENVITIGNEDMQQDFNAHWVSKLLVACDETKLDKHEVIQKIKRLSTADKIVMNSKGKDQVTLEFFAKFLLIANDEADFIRIDKEEIRFWVIKVPQLAQVNKDMLQAMIEEIPAFLYYLSQRQMITTNQERHWFNTDLLFTDALKTVKDNSMSTAEKRMRIELKEWFDFTGLPVLTWPMREIAAQLLKGFDKSYIQKVLNKMGYTTKSGWHSYPISETVIAKASEQTLGQEPTHEVNFKMIKINTTYYEFERKDFTDTEAQPEMTKQGLPF